VLDPKGGYVVTANQAVTGPSYPYYIGDSFDYGYRSERIRNLLLSTDKLTVDDMSGIQLDDFSLLAKRLTAVLRSVKVPAGYYSQGQRLLGTWDFREDADSSAAGYFNVVWQRLLALTFDDQLPKDAWPDGGDRWWRVVLNLVKEPHNAFWDDVTTSGVRETRDDILREAMIQARDELTRIRSRDPHEWQWGDLHTLSLRNETLGDDSSPVAFLFNRTGFHLGGGGSLVDATSWDATEGFQATSVPSMRMVVPLDDLDASRWINLTGESGHAYDANYTDQTDLWVKGETLPWAFSAAAVTAAGTDTLRLEPAS
jgi:penicillin amidase